ncbi:CDP-glycerol glycerophosphotransferase family protein [Enterococcus sp. CWB-B31]|uniref:CDP-glycerol glycerophosphotransferase family protein n=1 Tax=Enterococcus sp. CWB-B31 TaxID=2885159 RepID=UPI001E56B241|nr:CDP-glycerol glycerophosphotransferase family protein [Enterococcus sp. CWB-B31]MCB5953553.1 CDP-glycerol glycerophosphotransferase family protein [Enterococcus sp. CWB-B31]
MEKNELSWLRKTFRTYLPEDMRRKLRDKFNVESKEKISQKNETNWYEKYSKQVTEQLKNNLQARLRTYYASKFDSAIINENVILYEVRDGTIFTDSPFAIFQYMISQKEFENFEHQIVFTAEKKGVFFELQKKYPEVNLKLIIRDTFEYMDALLEAKYLINNSTFNSFYLKREGQIYINTWHGTALKHMGSDYVQDPMNAKNVMRNFLMTDYILSPNDHMTNLFLHSYKLDGIWEGTILEGGHARNDSLFTGLVEKVQQDITDRGIDYDRTKKTVCYMPTWRGSDVGAPTDMILTLSNEIKLLENELGNSYNVLLKVHPYVFDKADQSSLFKGKLIPNDFDSNELFEIIDIMITDYSSVFFDFLLTGKPILFYCWDNDIYENERGMYFDASELPGPTVYTLDDLINAIKDITQIEIDHKEIYKKCQKRFVSHDDGDVTKRYVERIFKSNKTNGMKEVKANTSKIKLLIHPGGMIDNGITNSFLNLIDQIDYDKYDVTAFLHDSTNPEIVKNWNKMNRHVRKMFKPGLPIYTFEENIFDRYLKNVHMPSEVDKYLPELGYKREAQRLFAGLHFDVTINFDGYSYFWAKYLLFVGAKKKICFMHNDLYSEINKKVNGEYTIRNDLLGLFSLYPKFDSLISVSKNLMNINLDGLKEYVKPSQMGFVENSINIEKIVNRPQADSDIEINKHEQIWVLMPNTSLTTFDTLHEIPLRKKSIKIDKIVIVRSIAEYVNSETIYYKIICQNQYLGWVSEHDLIPYMSDDDMHFLTRRTKFDYSGIFSNSVQSCDVRKQPQFGAEINSLNVQLFSNCILRIDEIAIDKFSTYIHCSYEKYKIGWIEIADIKITKNELLFEQEASELFEEFKEWTNAKIFNKRIYAQIKFPTVQTYDSCQQIHKQFNEWSPGVNYVYKVLDKLVVDGMTYCKLSLGEHCIGWVDEHQLDFLATRIPEFSKYEFMDWQQKDVLFVPKKNVIKLYKNISLDSYEEINSEIFLAKACSIEGQSISHNTLIFKVQIEGSHYFVTAEDIAVETLSLENVLIGSNNYEKYNFINPKFVISKILSTQGLIYRVFENNQVRLYNEQELLGMIPIVSKQIIKNINYVNSVGAVKAGDAIWLNPYGMFEPTVRVATSYLVSGLKFITDYEVTLLNGVTYKRLLFNDHFYGWINSEYFITDFSLENMDSDHYSNLPKQLFLLDQEISLEITNSISTFNKIFEKLSGELTYNKIKTNTKLKVDAKMILQNGEEYYRLSSKQEHAGWISEEELFDVSLNKKVEKKQSDINYLVSEKDISLLVKKKDSQLKCYLSEQDILLNEAHTISLTDTFQIERVLNYTHGMFYKIFHESKSIYCFSKDVEIVYSDFLSDLSSEIRQEIKPDDILIVAMGRLSPEKNQGELIFAMEKVTKQFPNAKLILLGKGPLEQELRTRVAMLNLQKNVFFAGQIDYPFSVIRQSDIFALASIHEGQPMVLLESLVLGKKIVASNIPQNEQILGANDDYGILTKGLFSDDLSEALLKALTSTNNFKKFDGEKYNCNALNQFYNLIES